MNKVFVYVWEFTAAEGCESEFAHVYGPEGDWVHLFRRAEGYINTELMRSAGSSNRFITIDSWESRDHYNRFITHYATEFDALDRRCRHLTSRESKLGEYEGTLPY